MEREEIKPVQETQTDTRTPSADRERQISELNCKDPMFILSAAATALKRTR